MGHVTSRIVMPQGAATVAATVSIPHLAAVWHSDFHPPSEEVAESNLGTAIIEA